MRTSKSSMPFGRQVDGTDHEPLGRPRGRSSLDTFIIPGRTRFPSSKLSAPEPVDLQITQGLLNPDAFKVPKMTVKREDKAKSWYTSEHEPPFDDSPKSRRQVSGRSIVIVTPLPNSKRKKPSTPQPSLKTREATVIPTLYGNSEDSQEPLFHCRLNSGSSEQVLNPFDGPFDSGPESLPTSGTWSTVSNRIFTDSSAGSSSREIQGFVDQYNRLALKHGLPRFTEPPVPIDIAKDTHTDLKITSKSHNNWLMRKILRRTSSSYNVKVKSTNKRVARKMSISSISDRTRKDILKDKSLEEIGRLSGLSILVLPPEFAVDKLTLPTCLSATATYLSQHGRTTPGVFRVPGQQNTVNALYDYYAHQYSSADSISDHVQQTIGSGLLPTHIPHSVHDVASVFKKLIAGLPGGLLGSIMLFKALRSIADHLHPSPALSYAQNIRIRARLIALALSSVISALRVSLIWAVLGLAALIGHEAEKAEQAENIKGTDGERHRRVSFELMGYRSLGVVLGPLLLGDLTDEVAARDENERGGLLVLPESPKKRRKDKKKEKINDKLEQSSDLVAHVERANVTARVVEMLLRNWQEVVKQLRNINATRNGGSLATSESRQRLVSANSRLTMQPSEEELLFDFLRGRPSTSDFTSSMKVKKRVKISNRSPSSHRAIWATDSSGGSRHGKGQRGIASRKSPAKHTASEVLVVEEVGDTQPTSQYFRQGESLTHSALASPGEDGLILQHPFTGKSSEQDGLLESLENAAELTDNNPSLQPSTYQFVNGYSLPLADVPDTTATQVPIRASHLVSGYSLPQADLPNTTTTQGPTAPSHPEIEAAKTTYQGEGQPQEQQDTDQDPMPSMTTGLPQPRPAQDPHTETDATEQTHADNAISPSSAIPNPFAEEPRLPAPIRQNSVRQLAQLFGSGPPSPQRKGRSLDIAPLRSHAYPRHPSADHAPPTPTAPRSPLQLPSQSPTATDKPTPRSAHDSLIPKPIHDFGRGRKSVTRSPSPTRDATPHAPLPLPPNPSSVFTIRPDATATTITIPPVSTSTTTTTIPPSAPTTTTTTPPTTPLPPRTTSRSLSPTKPAIPPTPATRTPPRRVNSMGPIRARTPSQLSAPQLVPLSPRARAALSAESLRRMRAALEEPPVAARIIPRGRSFSTELRTGGHSHCRSATTGNLDELLLGFLPQSLVEVGAGMGTGMGTGTESGTGAGMGSATNATLYASIRRLQRQLDLRSEELTQVRRSLDAVREASEGAGANANGMGKGNAKGMGKGMGMGMGMGMGKGTLSEELRECRRELRGWRGRAEWAEGRLLGLGLPVVMPVVVAVREEEGGEEGEKGEEAMGEGREVEEEG